MSYTQAIAEETNAETISYSSMDKGRKAHRGTWQNFTKVVAEIRSSNRYRSVNHRP